MRSSTVRGTIRLTGAAAAVLVTAACTGDPVAPVPDPSPVVTSTPTAATPDQTPEAPVAATLDPPTPGTTPLVDLTGGTGPRGGVASFTASGAFFLTYVCNGTGDITVSFPPGGSNTAPCDGTTYELGVDTVGGQPVELSVSDTAIDNAWELTVRNG